MTSPAIALRFETKLPHPNTINNILAHFREQGYAIIPNVFERDSVDAFRAQVEAALVPDDKGQLALPQDSPLRIYPAMAPVLRPFMRGALSPATMKPHASLFECAWLISPATPAPPPGTPRKPIAEGWHKDRWHETYPSPGGDYLYPDDGHLGMYFLDMTPALGPTYVIPRSHRDARLSPHSGAEEVPFLARKQDVVLWDQRLWHRGSPRTEPGNRIFAIYGFYRVPCYDDTPHQMSRAQLDAWAKATNGADRILLGGPFAHRDDNQAHAFR